MSDDSDAKCSLERYARREKEEREKERFESNISFKDPSFSSKSPCYNRGFQFPAAHCAPPVGYREKGYDCVGCPLKIISSKHQKLSDGAP